jgi:phage N-6-adenine-methyltransferase
METADVNSALMFSKASDEWSTPQDFWRELDREFCFEMDVAATPENAKMLPCITREVDALAVDWFDAFCEGDASEARACGVPPPICWLNPPYSRCAEFVAKAAEEAQKGCTVVLLIPSRTDTRYWHAHIWDRETHQPKPGVEIRFVKGRLKFGAGKNSAPFPSVVIVMRPPA